MNTNTDWSISLFDGVTLDGWNAVPAPRNDVARRTDGQRGQSRAVHPLRPPSPARALPTEVVDRAIDGRQDPARPGCGGYLVPIRHSATWSLGSRNPEWPADTGIMIGGSRKPGDQPRADGTHKARLLRRVGDVHRRILALGRLEPPTHHLRRSTARDHHLGQRPPGRRARHGHHRPSAP